MAVRFKRGDIIQIAKYWDIGEEVWYYDLCVHIRSAAFDMNSGGWVYGTKMLKGPCGWTAYGCRFFDELPYLCYLGNIYEDETLRILYGPAAKI